MTIQATVSLHGVTPDLKAETPRMFDLIGTYTDPDAICDLAALQSQTPIGGRPSALPAGYTYFGQFVDHDITFSKTSLDESVFPPGLITEDRYSRSATLNLDSLYGSGIDDQVVFFDTNTGHFCGERREPNSPIEDFLRLKGGKALIGDSRNDENLVVARLHSVFMNFHNRVIEELGGVSEFERARKEVTLCYQKLILNDFLPRILNERTYELLFGIAPKTRPFIKATGNHWLTLPVEFRGAAFRFGHSMVKPSYLLAERDQMATRLEKLMAWTGNGGMEGRTNTLGRSLEWRKFFDFGEDNEPTIADKISTELAEQLLDLRTAAGQCISLVEKNLEETNCLQLPTAQQCIDFIGETRPDYKATLKLEKLSPSELKSHDLGQIIDENWLTNTPLWTYILMEPEFHNRENRNNGVRLGMLGSTIVGEIFRVLLATSDYALLGKDSDYSSLCFSDEEWDDLKMKDLISFAIE